MGNATRWLVFLAVQACLTVAQSATASASTASATASGDDGGGDEDTMGPMMVAAHASVMSLAFLFFYPLGAIVMRIGVGKRTIWIHAYLQIFAYLLALAGMGLGIWLAVTEDTLNAQTYHTIIGLVVVCALFLQAPLGLLHHWFYKRNGKRNVLSYIHMWFGRALITLGAINGGFGVQLSADSIPGTIAYGTLAGVIYVGYFVLIASTIGRSKRIAAKNAAADHQGEIMEKDSL